MSDCSGTGGKRKSWVQAFYSGVITLTTVGFGDVTPVSALGRILGMVWMIFGVLATCHLVTAISIMMAALNTHRKKKSLKTREILGTIEVETPQFLSHSEFMLFMLMRDHKIRRKEIRALKSLCRAVDKQNMGKIPFEKVVASIDGKTDENDDDDDRNDDAMRIKFECHWIEEYSTRFISSSKVKQWIPCYQTKLIRFD